MLHRESHCGAICANRSALLLSDKWSMPLRSVDIIIASHKAIDYPMHSEAAKQRIVLSASLCTCSRVPLFLYKN